MSRRPRARELGIPFDGTPGAWNAITDVPGVRLGHTTVIRDTPGDAAKAVRTGVTALLPKSRTDVESVFAGWFRLNGFGEMTGTAWIDEAGLVDGPIVTTSTASVGVAHSAVPAYAKAHRPDVDRWNLPVVAETWDGYLSDPRGGLLKTEDVFSALDSAASGPVLEGSVGGGTGSIAYEFKAGIGTASRQVRSGGQYCLGALVQANHGRREQLHIAGIPIGRAIPEGRTKEPESGSLIGIVATDAPLLPHQLTRLARRCALGLARSGAISGNGSGDLFLAFSTANDGQIEEPRERHLVALSEEALNPFFGAVVEAIDEAIVNALIAAETMTGLFGRTVLALPHEPARELLRRHGRLNLA